MIFKGKLASIENKRIAMCCEQSSAVNNQIITDDFENSELNQIIFDPGN